jgi:MFS family permease
VNVNSVLKQTLTDLRELGVILSISFFMFLGFRSGGVLQPLYTQFFEIEPGLIGTLFFLSNIASSLVRIPAGLVSDKYGRKPIIVIAAATFLAASGLYMVANDFISMLAPFILWGSAAGFFFTSINALIADKTNTDNRVTAFARIGMINMIANIIGPTLTGILADSLGIVLSFSVLVATFVLMTIFSLRISEPKKEDPEIESEIPSLSLIKGSARPIIIGYSGLRFIFGIYAGMYWPALTIVQKSVFQLSYSEIGLVSAINMISQLFGLSLCNRTITKFNPRYVMTLSSLVAFGIATIYYGVDSYVLLLLVSIISGFSFSFSFLSPIGNSLFMNALPSSIRGISQGIIGTVWRIGMATGSLLMGLIWDHSGLHMILYAGAATMLIEAVALFFLLPKNPARIETE